MMDYETWVLEQLLTKYEKSKAFTSGVFSKRIAIDVNREKTVQELLERPDEKSCFLSVLSALKAQEMLDYSWVKHEKGNLVEKIWLIPEETAIRRCYQSLKRIPKKDRADSLKGRIELYKQELDNSTPIGCFLDDMLVELKDKQQNPRFFTEDDKLNEDILKCLVYMEKNHDELMERLMSSKLYGDSKHFERKVKSKILSVLRYIKKIEDEDIPDDDELLGEKGIVRWPEVMEFTGKIAVILKDGDSIDYSVQKYGAYINSDTVKEVNEIVVKGLNRIIFIENKANYIWYVSHRKEADELVIFHGGCYSPVKGLWFRKIYMGCKRQAAGIRYFHWSDIDIGGFHIFTRLKKSIIPELEPYKMNVATLENYRDRAMEIQSLFYKAALEKMGQDSEYEEFWNVIQKMLAWEIRLEQEQIIV